MATAIENYTHFTSEEDDTLMPMYQFGYQPVYYFLGYHNIDDDNRDEVCDWIENLFVDDATLEEYGGHHKEYIQHNFYELSPVCDELWDIIVAGFGKIADYEECCDRAEASLESACSTDEVEDLLFIMDDLREQIARERTSLAHYLVDTYGENFLDDARRRFGESHNADAGAQQCAHLKQKSIYEDARETLHEMWISKARHNYRGKNFDPSHVRKPYPQEVLDSMPRWIRAAHLKHQHIREQFRTRMDYRRFQRTVVAQLQLAYDADFVVPSLRTELISGIGAAALEDKETA